MTGVFRRPRIPPRDRVQDLEAPARRLGWTGQASTVAAEAQAWLYREARLLTLSETCTVVQPYSAYTITLRHPDHVSTPRGRR